MKPSLAAALVLFVATADPRGQPAPKPLFRDPVHDGAADPVVVYDRAQKKWLMFYTNRRANVTEGVDGVSWVHGTRIGIAQSTDEGATWTYEGMADIPYGGAGMTHWAPEVIEHEGRYHMFLTFVPGIFSDWQHPRDIVHLTSTDLRHWAYASTLKLAADRVIDACVLRLPDGSWRLWYNNERDGKSIYYADSRDLDTWVDKGRATGTGERPGEGPKVFRWHGSYWMAVDIWDGIRMYRSDDALVWQRSGDDLLKTPGTGADDAVKGGHADVVVSGERAFLFYFTHPGRRGQDARADGGLGAQPRSGASPQGPSDGIHSRREPPDELEQRRSSIQVVELEWKDGAITCDRDRPTYVRLVPPASPEGTPAPRRP